MGEVWEERGRSQLKKRFVEKRVDQETGANIRGTSVNTKHRQGGKKGLCAKKQNVSSVNVELQLSFPFHPRLRRPARLWAYAWFSCGVHVLPDRSECASCLWDSSQIEPRISANIIGVYTSKSNNTRPRRWTRGQNRANVRT